MRLVGAGGRRGGGHGLRGDLRSLLAVAGPNVVVDLREVTFMDASGLGVLATSGHIARQAAVARCGWSGRRTRSAGCWRSRLLDQVLPIYDDLQEALSAV